ncbi:hypothetical protein AMECASPLE_034861 [Ameca splendens]|uniref:Uncharacterized protein n=1 Tax=Ameca splendens TaxID=208324 RepID=A0ABV0Z663_9TELE
MLRAVRLAFNAALCDALSAERGDALHTNRATYGAARFFGQDAQSLTLSLRKRNTINQIIGRFERLPFDSHAFLERICLFFKELRAKLSLHGIFGFSAVIFFWLRDIKKIPLSLFSYLSLSV